MRDRLDPLRGKIRGLISQRFIDGFARFLNLGLAPARKDDRMGIGVVLVGNDAGDAGPAGSILMSKPPLSGRHLKA